MAEPKRKNVKRRQKKGGTRSRRAAAVRRKTSAQPPPSMSAPESGLAPGMQLVNVYLAVANVTASMEFLEKAFGFVRGVALAEPDGQVRYAEMRHGDGAVMLVRKGDTAAPTNGAAAIYTYVEDVDRALERARGAGGGADAAEDKPWGDRVGAVVDPDGYRWMLATFKKLPPFS